jgi:hypothetical protein
MTALKDRPICEAMRVVSSLTPSSRRIVLVAIFFLLSFILTRHVEALLRRIFADPVWKAVFFEKSIAYILDIFNTNEVICVYSCAFRKDRNVRNRVETATPPSALPRAVSYTKKERRQFPEAFFFGLFHPRYDENCEINSAL